MQIKTKDDRRQRIRYRIRKRMRGTSERPRLSVFRSVSHIYVQVIDDMAGTTVASASSVEPTVKAKMEKDTRAGNRKGAELVGQTIAERLEGKGDHARDLRSQRVPLSRARARRGRSRPVGRPGVLGST